MSTSTITRRRGTLARRRGIVRRFAGVALGVTVVVAGLAFGVFAPLPGTTPDAQAACARGVIDYRLEASYGVDLAAVPAMTTAMGPSGLGARWTRLIVHWDLLQPTAPGTAGAGDLDDDGYDDAYVRELDTIVDSLRAQNVTIILTGRDVPEWASDSRYWEGGFDDKYAMRIGDPVVRLAFKDFGKFLANHFAGRVRHFEVWNEPNLGSAIYPQIVRGVAVGPRVYCGMLKAFAAGAREGAANTVVIAGSTGPRGSNNVHGSSPQYFARYFKAHVGGSWYDAYAHHPYTPGGSRNVRPGQLPNYPTRCVTLGNLNQLTKLFPKKPFYLTEFGYNTQYCQWFGITVSPANQARYLRRAYSYVASRYKQVKVLLWFLVDDMPAAAGEPASTGVYMGLRTADGRRKPGWYAFAGGNRLSLTMPAGARPGVSIPVTGVLTSKQTGGDEPQTLTLQARTPRSSAWKTVAKVKTDPATGAYSRTIRQASRTRVYRIVWGGVCESKARTVRIR